MKKFNSFLNLSLKGLIIFLFCSFNLSFSGTYYVSTSGSNTNPGSFSQPWATPGYGSRQINSGDTLVILGGRYLLSEYIEDILEPPSGTSTSWTVIRGENSNRPILCGRNNLLTAIILSGKSYIVIENLEITHDAEAQGDSCWFRDGIEIFDEPANFLIFRNLYIHHIDEFGMNFQDVNNVEIENCRIEYCGFGAIGGPAGNYGGWRNIIINNCSLSWSGHYYQGGDGSNRPYDRPDGFGNEQSIGPILIKNTIAQHNYGDGLDSKSAHTLIQRCIVANNSCDGVKLWGDSSRIENTLIYGRGDGNPEVSPWAPIVIHQVEQSGAYFEIFNVTVDDSLGEEYLLYAQYEDSTPVHITIRNCIFSGRGPNTTLYVHGNSTLIADHNLFFIPLNSIILYHGNQEYSCSNISMLGSGNICGDPLFIQTAWGSTGDYHLRQGSPAINAGSIVGAPPVDLDGNIRDANPDIGAYEFTTQSLVMPGSDEQHLISVMQCYPNPFNETMTIKFSILKKMNITLKVFDMLGREVANMVIGELEIGEHSVFFKANNLTSGAYIYSLQGDNVVQKRKVVLIK
ncbi:MAG: right-handed parallel beta-helix repeat-containing protein [Ignavibacteria bacterium]